MNTRPFSLLALATALTAFALAPVSAAPQTKPALAHPVVAVKRDGQVLFARGSTTADVLRSLGTPRNKLGTDVWVYYNFNGGDAQDRRDDCETLLVTFTAGRVSEMKLVNDRAEKVYAAQIRAKANDQVQVASK